MLILGNQKQRRTLEKIPESLRPKKARQVRSATNSMPVLFFFLDIRGIVRRKFVPHGQILSTQEFYCIVLRRVSESWWGTTFVANDFFHFPKIQLKLPYRRFAILEEIQPGGASMPSLKNETSNDRSKRGRTTPPGIPTHDTVISIVLELFDHIAHTFIFQVF